MEMIYSSETSVETQQTTLRRIPEDDTLQVQDSSFDVRWAIVLKFDWHPRFVKSHK
jgi:hypothetical protein